MSRILDFLQMRWNLKDFSNKVLVLNATIVLIFLYKNARNTSFKKYYTARCAENIAIVSESVAECVDSSSFSEIRTVLRHIMACFVFRSTATSI